MIPTRLTLANFMCYRADDEAPSLDFDGLHVVVLSGENGAGKSTLLDAITWAIWGEARLPDDELIAQGASEMWVELEFLLGDQRYRVRRARQRGGTGKRGGQTAGKSQLDLQCQDGAGWRTLSELTIRETQERIDDLLRMSYQTFINASFLLQGRADEFTARTPADRKKVLAEILDLREYELLETRAKERTKDLDSRLRNLRGELENLRQTASQLRFWCDQVAAGEEQVARLHGELDAAEQARAAAVARRTALEQQAAQRKELLGRLERLRVEQAGHQARLTSLAEAIARADALIARRDAITTGMQALAEARSEAERLEALRDRHDELQRRREELGNLFKDARADLTRTLAAAEERHERLARNQLRRDELRTTLTALSERLAALVPVAAERERRAQEAQGLALRAVQLDELQRRHDALSHTIKLRMDSLVAAREARREAVARFDQQLAEAERWRGDLHTARADQAALVAAEARLSALRADEQADLDRASERRAACKGAEAEAKKLKGHQQLLQNSGGSCPVCQSELGASGLERVHAHYEDELTALRAAFADARAEAERSEARLNSTRSAIAEAERALGGLRRSAARVEALEQQLAQAQGWQVEAERLRTELADLRAQIEAQAFDPAAQAELASVAEELSALGDPQELAQDRAILDERLRELDGRLQERGQIEGRREASGEELRRIEAELGELPALAAQVAELRRALEERDFAHAIQQQGHEVRAAIEALGFNPQAHAEARQRVSELRRWEEEERALALAEQGRERDLVAFTQAEELLARDAAELNRLTNDEAALAEALRGLPQALAAAEQAESARKERQQLLQVAQNDLGQKQGYRRVAQDAADRLVQREADEQALAQRHGLFAELAEAWGKKGVQAMLIDTAIPQIEDEANRLLARMTDGQMHLSLDTQRDTKKGDTVETLEIRIADPLGTRTYDAFSGGEAMRVNFALRIALSRLLARRAGARLETLVIDEGFGALDALGRERMVEAITSVQEDFKRIVVITHIDELKDRFPALIEVTKGPTGSRWQVR